MQCPCEDELGTKICSNLRPIKQYQLCVSKFDNGPTITTIGIKVINTYNFLWNLVKDPSNPTEIELLQHSRRTSILQRKTKIWRKW